jgi:hypothetical protein
MGYKENTDKSFVRKSEGRRGMGIHMHRWKDNYWKRSLRNEVENCGVVATSSGLGPVAGPSELGNEQWIHKRRENS